MRVLVACDSFKDALPAAAACEAIAAGLLQADASLTVERRPLADGGEGAFQVLAAPLGLHEVQAEAADPLGRPVAATYGLSNDGAVAVVEMAAASGLQRLAPAEREPLITTSLGTGQLMADAVRRGAKRIVLAIGGSATNDGGVGAASALGWRFTDVGGQLVEPVGGRLGDIANILAPVQPQAFSLEVLCDVTNPLFGPQGAAWIYGRQKGGTDASLARLDAGLRGLAALVESQLGLHGLADAAGAGAAGGMGFGAMAFLGGRLRPGAETIMDVTGFDEALAACDLVITGEGQLDGQTLQGKLLEALCRRAAAKAKPVVALCGRVRATPEQIRAIGLSGAVEINRQILPLAQMLAATAQTLQSAAAGLDLRKIVEDFG